MPNLSIKDVPEDLAEALRSRAARNHRSLQGELMAIIEAAVDQERIAPPVGKRESFRRGWKSIEQSAAELRARFPDPITNVELGVDIIRRERDAR